ncbi:hypothetical protein [Kistimonas scapharcae]
MLDNATKKMNSETSKNVTNEATIQELKDQIDKLKRDLDEKKAALQQLQPRKFSTLSHLMATSLLMTAERKERQKKRDITPESVTDTTTRSIDEAKATVTEEEKHDDQKATAVFVNIVVAPTQAAFLS